MNPSNNQNGNRLDRIETILLELATASVRHANEFSRIHSALERLEQVAEQQQTTIAQHEQTLSRIEAQQELNIQMMDRIEAQQELNIQAIARIEAQQEINQQQIALNRENINTLTTSIQELRNLVANYIQSCSQIEKR
jgi:chromosome segregation ATPase